MTASSDPAMRAVAIPRLHLVTDDSVLQREDFQPLMAAVLAAGGGRLALHLRGHGIPGARLLELAQEAVELGARPGAHVLVNDRVDVAIAAGASGVQLGRRSLPIDVARRLVGGDRLVGASVHSAAEAESAMASGADFLLAGNIWSTQSHPGEPGRGTEWLREIASIGVPVVAIGGVTAERVAALRAAGATGAAVIRHVWSSPDPVRAVGRMLGTLYPEEDRG